MAEVEGIKRSIDDLGRVVIPREYLTELRFPRRVEVFLLKDGSILLKIPEKKPCPHCGKDLTTDG